MFQGFFMIFKGVSRVFQGSFKKTLKVFKKILMLHDTHRSFPSRRRACSKPTSIRLQDTAQFNEYKIQYRSHMEKKEGYVDSCYFRFDNQMYTQKED